MPKIPDLEYVADQVEGTIYRLSDQTVLLIGLTNSTLTEVAQGTFTIRYAIPLLTPATQAIIPGLFVGERGGTLVGHEAWEYMQNRFQMHPRADVIGLLLEGTRGEYWIRDLDFGARVRVFVYATAQDTTPLIELTGYRSAEGTQVPELIKRYLPVWG